MRLSISLCLAMSIACIGCKSSSPTAQVSTIVVPKQELKGSTPAQAMASAVVYKTTRDFSDCVPVTMDAKHEHIVSYPAPSDLYYKGQLAKPVALAEGYWLDNRGISEHVAFLDYTYEEYSQLSEAPGLEVLESKILERYPLTEMYVCGKRNSYTHEVEELNRLIKEGFVGCRKVSLPIPLKVTLQLK